MTSSQRSNVIDLNSTISHGDRAVPPPENPTDASPGRLLDIIPVPEIGQYMVIVAHLVSADEAASTEVAYASEAAPEIDGLRIDRSARQVWVDGDEIPLTFQEYELLEFLAASPGKVFTRNHLMNALWPGPGYVSPRTVDVHVHRLRRKLGRHGSCLVTVRRFGYGYRPPLDRTAD